MIVGWLRIVFYLILPASACASRPAAGWPPPSRARVGGHLVRANGKVARASACRRFRALSCLAEAIRVGSLRARVGHGSIHPCTPGAKIHQPRAVLEIPCKNEAQ